MTEEIKKIHFKRGDILVVNEQSADKIIGTPIPKGYHRNFTVPIIVVNDLDDIKTFHIINILKIYIKNLFNWR